MNKVIKVSIFSALLLILWVVAACSGEPIPERGGDRPPTKTRKPTRTVLPTKTPPPPLDPAPARPTKSPSAPTPSVPTPSEGVTPAHVMVTAAPPSLGGLPTRTPTPTTGSIIPTLLTSGPRLFVTSTPTATATPNASFTVEYQDYLNCGFNTYLVSKVTNTGSVSFEYGVFWFEELENEISMGSTESNAPFKKSPTLCLLGGNSALSPGNQAFLYVRMRNLDELEAADSTLPYLNGAFSLCTQDDAGGHCEYRVYHAPLPP